MPRRLLDDDDRPIRGKTTRAEPSSSRPDTEPRSWRDRDRVKDRSAHAPKETSNVPSATSTAAAIADRQRKQHLAAANALFSNNGVESLERTILSASGSALLEAIDTYLRQYGYPDRADLLCRFLEHTSGDVIKSTLQKLEPTFSGHPPDMQAKILQVVRLTSMTARDEVARKSAISFLRRVNRPNVST